MDNKSTILDEMQVISQGLDVALEAGLEVEVIYFALDAMKNHPGLSISEAFIFGVAEWVK